MERSIKVNRTLQSSVSKGRNK